MTIEMQVSTLDFSVDEFVRCVASLDEELFFKNIDRWSPRDMVAHLIGWNGYIIEGSTQIKRGELPFYDIDPGENYSKMNAVLVQQFTSGDKQELLDLLRASAEKLKQFLQSLDQSEWDRDYGVRHQGSTITIRNTVDDLISDYAHHRKQIEEWTGTTA